MSFKPSIESMKYLKALATLSAVGFAIIAVSKHTTERMQLYLLIIGLIFQFAALGFLVAGLINERRTQKKLKGD